MIQIRALGYVGVESPRYAAWEDIGPNVFAMQLFDPGPDGAVRLKVDDYDYRIAVHPGETDRLRYIGWEVGSDEDLDEAADALARVGVPHKSGSSEQCDERRVARMLRFHDPAGLRFELFSGASVRYRSFAPPRHHGGFVTGDQGLGHLVIAVPDPEAEDAFLRNVLNFRLTDEVKAPMGRLPFYHVNRRHHSLACLPTPGLHGLNHIMVQVNEIDDVGIAWDIVQTRDDLPFTITLGRHSTDRMLSFYVRTPTGFDIEYGWGAITLEGQTAATVTGFPAEIFGHSFQQVPPNPTITPVGASSHPLKGS